MADVAVDGHDDVGGLACSGGGIAQRGVERDETGDALLLVTERLDDALAREHLLDVGIDGTKVVLLRLEVGGRSACQPARHDEHDACHQDIDERQRHAEHHHRHERRHDGDQR